jgi:hypothetical protein
VGSDVLVAAHNSTGIAVVTSNGSDATMVQDEISNTTNRGTKTKAKTDVCGSETSVVQDRICWARSAGVTEDRLLGSVDVEASVRCAFCAPFSNGEQSVLAHTALCGAAR